MKKLLLLAAMLALTSCQAVQDVLNDNTLLTGVAAYEATEWIIEAAEDPEARARRILAYTEAAVEIVDSSTPTTLASLHTYISGLVMAQVPEIDRQPAQDMLDALRVRLAIEIDEYASLTPETEVSLLHVIQRIRIAAEHHVNG